MYSSLRMVNKVAFYRKRSGITQGELADLVGVSRNTICSIERGHFNPSVILAQKLSFALRVPFYDLFEFIIA